MGFERLARRERTAARPGPGPLRPSLLQALNVELTRRIEGLLAGDHLSSALGRGTELAQIRPYVIGDDVRQIEWNATARMQVPHVRVDVAERALSTWIVLDASPSMAFGTADRRKADVAEGVAITIGHLGVRGANRVGVATFGGPRERILSPAGGRRALFGILQALRHDPDPDLPSEGSLARTLKHLRGIAAARGVVFVIADLIGEPDWTRPLLHLASRHDVVVVEIRDPREDGLTDVGDVWFRDPESGGQLRVDTSSKALRDRFAEAARAERRDVRRMVRTAGADHIVLSTDGDWLRPFSDFLKMRRLKRVRR